MIAVICDMNPGGHSRSRMTLKQEKVWRCFRRDRPGQRFFVAALLRMTFRERWVRQYFSSDAIACTVPSCASSEIMVPVFGTVTIHVADTAGVAQAELPVYAFQVVEIPPEEPAGEPEGGEGEPQGEENQAALTELVYSGIHGVTGADGLVTLDLPEGNYRFRSDLHGHQYFSAEESPVAVPAMNTAGITVPVFGEVVVTVEDKDHEPQPDLPVYVFTGTTYSGISATTDGYGKATLLIPEGVYRFRADQFEMQFWSDTADHCTVPAACSTALITVLGTNYSSTYQNITYSYDDLNRLTAAEYDSGLYYHYSYDAVGNRISGETMAGVTPVTYNYTYDDARGTKWSTPERSERGYRLTAVNGQTYTFDENGNLLSDGEYSYTYDSANRLVGINRDDISVSYAYNGDGTRLQQTANGETLTYTTDLNRAYSQVLFDGTNSYVYGLERIGTDSPDGYYDYLHTWLRHRVQATPWGVCAR